MIILGIDPGSRFLGYGLINRVGNKHTHVENGTLYLNKIDSYPKRLAYLHQRLNELIDEFNPEALSVENIFYHKNPKSIQKLGEVRGVVICAGAARGLAVDEYTPLQVKRAVTGYGNAKKDQMQYMVKMLLNLRDVPEENASDALGLALCHAITLGSLKAINPQQKTSLTKNQDLLKQASFFR